MSAEPNMIQSVGRAARILKALGSEQARLGVTELAERLGLAKATVYGLLRTLEAHQFVEQDIETGKYRLGPALLQLGNAFLDNHELRARSLLWAESLASRAREAVHVGVLYGPNVLIVHHVFRPDDSVQILEVGASIPWHACALGKAMVAFLEPSQRKELLDGGLPRLTGQTLTDPEALVQELDRIVREGVAIEDQEAIVGEAGIAAPLFDHRGAVVGGIALAGPVEHLLPGDSPAGDLLAAVRESARGLSRELGASRLSLPGAGA
jgi:DNA-binding IclR family transcriptional regulator